MPHYQFSSFASKSLVPSPVNAMTAQFATDFRQNFDINLGVGYVNDETIPWQKLHQAFEAVHSDPERYKNPLNYGGAEGSAALRASIEKFYIDRNIGGLDSKIFQHCQILIGANGATSLLEALAEVLQPGIVITANPYYYIYTDFLERKGYTIAPIDEDNRGICVDKLQEFLLTADCRKISFIYIPTVNNPSCTVLSSERIEQLVKIADDLSEKTGRLIPIVFDKAYQELIYGNVEPVPSGLKYDTKGNVFEIGTVSKIVAPALRIGYLIAKESQMTQVLTQKISDTGFSAPLINQEICSYFMDHCISEQIDKVNAGYKRKADFLKKQIDEKLHPWLENCTGGEAGFYYYFTFKTIETHKDSPFFKFLSRTTGNLSVDGKSEKNARLVYIPGNICAQGERGKRQMRISFGFEETEVLEKALSLISEACEYADSVE